MRVSSDWFQVYRVAEGVFALVEPFQLAQVARRRRGRSSRSKRERQLNLELRVCGLDLDRDAREDAPGARRGPGGIAALQGSGALDRRA